MCTVTSLANGARVAEIKRKYIENIVDAAKDCKHLDRIILFGSASGERCTEESDIDIAVFSQLPMQRFLSSKSFRDFMDAVYCYDFDQDYDVLYFKSGKRYNRPIYDEVMRGSVIYGE